MDEKSKGIVSGILMAPLTLHDLKKYLKEGAIEAEVFDDYTYPELGPGAVLIQTNVAAWIVEAWLDPVWPIGVQMIIRPPKKPDPQSCICFGPPSKNCPVHK